MYKMQGDISIDIGQKVCIIHKNLGYKSYLRITPDLFQEMVEKFVPLPWKQSSPPSWGSHFKLVSSVQEDNPPP